MLIYFLGFLLSIIFTLLSIKTKNVKLQKILRIVAILPFLLISAFRYNVGIDTWKNYGPAFDSIANYGEHFDTWEFLLIKYEVGFSLLMLLLANICKHSVILFTVCSIVTIGFTYISIYQQSKNTLFSIFLFFFSGAFLLSMNGMRNYMSLAIVLYAIKYIKDNKFWKYLFWIFLASLIHKTALLFLILYPLYKFKLSLKQIVILLVTSILSLPFIDKVIAFLLSRTSYIDYFIGDTGSVDPLYSMLLINSILLLLFLLNYKKCKEDKLYNLFLKMQVISVIVCLFSFKIPQTYRIEQIIDFIQILSIPYNFHCLKEKTKLNKQYYTLFLIGIIIIYCGYFTRSFIFTDSNQVRNYVSIFNKG